MDPSPRGSRLDADHPENGVLIPRLSTPMAEYFPKVPVEVGNELFWYVFDGDPVAEDGYISLSDDIAGLGLTLRRPDETCFKLHQ